jgi:hypothetical protein
LFSVEKAAAVREGDPNLKPLSFQFEGWVIGPVPWYSEKRTNAKKAKRNFEVPQEELQVNFNLIICYTEWVSACRGMAFWAPHIIHKLILSF